LLWQSAGALDPEAGLERVAIDAEVDNEPDEPEMGAVKTIGYEFDYPVSKTNRR